MSTWYTRPVFFVAEEGEEWLAAPASEVEAAQCRVLPANALEIEAAQYVGGYLK